MGQAAGEEVLVKSLSRAVLGLRLLLVPHTPTPTPTPYTTTLIHKNKK
jgi:hypothetical protein